MKTVVELAQFACLKYSRPQIDLVDLSSPSLIFTNMEGGYGRTGRMHNSPFQQSHVYPQWDVSTIELCLRCRDDHLISSSIPSQVRLFRNTPNPKPLGRAL
jgi:hypothetical protein